MSWLAWNAVALGLVLVSAFSPRTTGGPSPIYLLSKSNPNPRQFQIHQSLSKVYSGEDQFRKNSTSQVGGEKRCASTGRKCHPQNPAFGDERCSDHREYGRLICLVCLMKKRCNLASHIKIEQTTLNDSLRNRQESVSPTWVLLHPLLKAYLPTQSSSTNILHPKIDLRRRLMKTALQISPLSLNSQGKHSSIQLMSWSS